MAQTLSGQRRPPSWPRARNDVSTTQREEVPRDLDEDAVFDVLGAGRRRTALRVLHSHDGLASIGTLAERVAAEEQGVSRDAVEQCQRKRVTIALHQSHLPKMAEYGVVSYDRDAGLVRLQEPARIVLPYLYFDPRGGDSPPLVGEEAGPSLRRFLSRLLGR